MNKDDQQLPATYSVRLPASMRRQLEESARASGRSLHAEILLRLGMSLETSKEEKSNTNDDLESRVLRLEKTMEDMKDEVIEEVISATKLMQPDALRLFMQFIDAMGNHTHVEGNPETSVTQD